jgi:membrane protein required for beta-lactamase induction
MNRLIIILALAMLMPVSLAQAMSFNIVTIDLKISIHYYVYGTGEIAEGDTERFLTALRSSHVSPNDDILVFLDSPGWLACRSSIW